VIISKGLEVEKEPYLEMAYNNNKGTELMVVSEARMWELKDLEVHLLHLYVSRL